MLTWISITSVSLTCPNSSEFVRNIFIDFVRIGFGFIFKSYPNLGGTIGYELNLFFQDYIGKIGTAALLLLGVIAYLGIRLKVSP